MQYQELLNQFFEMSRCTAQELAAASGISASSISRYRQGKSQPDPESLQKLSEGVVAICEQKGIPLSEERKTEIRKALEMQETAFSSARFDTLLRVMQIQAQELAGYVQYMPSYLSKIRTGKRTPADAEGFVKRLGEYLAAYHHSAEDVRRLCELIGCTDSEELPFALKRWLLGTNGQELNGMGKFLRHLDDFDLNEYLSLFRFEALDVPAPQPVPEFHEDYYGLERIRQSHLDFFRLTVQSDSAAPIFMHDDMPMLEMAQDQAWDKAWMMAIALCLKKGLQMQVVHDVERPVREMLLGLEAWVPLYMTGQIAPYYFPSGGGEVFCHANFISGAAYLTGESVKGFYEDAWQELDTTHVKVAAAQKKAKALLKKAQPLMEIYNAGKGMLYQQAVEKRLSDKGDVTILHPSLPLHELPEGLLEGILKRSRIPQTQAEKILQFAAIQQQRFDAAVASNRITEVLPELTEAQFTIHPLRLSLEDSFCELPLTYTYPEYCMHLDALRKKAHPNYRFLMREDVIFRSTRITLKSGKWAVFSKINTPVTHFVLCHPKMVEAVQSFVRGVLEGEV